MNMIFRMFFAAAVWLGVVSNADAITPEKAAENWLKTNGRNIDTDIIEMDGTTWTEVK